MKLEDILHNPWQQSLNQINIFSILSLLKGTFPRFIISEIRMCDYDDGEMMMTMMMIIMMATTYIQLNVCQVLF